MKLYRLVLTFILVWGVSGLAWAAPFSTEKREKNRFDVRGGSEGYYFYKDPKEQPEKPKEQPSVSIPSVQSQAKDENTVPERYYGAPIDWQKVKAMHPDDFQKFLTSVQKWAVQAPSPERMKTYITLQYVAMERAKNFQVAWGDALRENPILDTTVTRSPSRVGSFMEVAQRREDRGMAIDKMKADMGLVYFYKDSCPYCDKEKIILQSFLRDSGWKNLKLVNIDKYPTAALKYNVQVVPDLWVVGNVKGKIEERRIKAGLATIADIESGLLDAYSVWFEGKRYEAPTMSGQVQEFDQYLDTVRPEQNEDEPRN